MSSDKMMVLDSEPLSTNQETRLIGRQTNTNVILDHSGSMSLRSHLCSSSTARPTTCINYYYPTRATFTYFWAHEAILPIPYTWLLACLWFPLSLSCFEAHSSDAYFNLFVIVGTVVLLQPIQRFLCSNGQVTKLASKQVGLVRISLLLSFKFLTINVLLEYCFKSSVLDSFM